MENKIKLFEDGRIRYAWDAEREEWFFPRSMYVMLWFILPARTLERAFCSRLQAAERSEEGESSGQYDYVELVLNMLAEVTTTAISNSRQPDSFDASKAIPKTNFNLT